MELNNKKWLLIQRYVTGNANEKEIQVVKRWMNRHPDNKLLVRELEKIWKLSPEEDFEVNIQAAWNEFKASRLISTSRPVLQLHKKKRKSNGRLVHAFRVAAFILVTFIAGYFTHHMSVIINESDKLTESPDSYAMQEITTDRGEKTRVTFSDGTKVMLNSASKLVFPESFHDSVREVHLEGEAFFKVNSVPDQPFIVNIDGVNVRVLGTEFNVRSWPEDPEALVVVRNGKVSVSSTIKNDELQSGVTLEGGYFTRVEKGEMPSPAQRVRDDYYLLWTSGGISFNNELMEQVIKNIERRFNVDITVIGDDLLEVPYTGTFQYAEVDEVLSVIAATVGFKYTRIGKEVEIVYDKNTAAMLNLDSAN